MSSRLINQQQAGTSRQRAPDTPANEADRRKMQDLEVALAEAKRKLEVFCMETNQTSSALAVETNPGDSAHDHPVQQHDPDNCCQQCGNSYEHPATEGEHRRNIPPGVSCVITRVLDAAPQLHTRYTNTTAGDHNNEEWYVPSAEGGFMGAQISGSIDVLADRVREAWNCERVFFQVFSDRPDDFNRTDAASGTAQTNYTLSGGGSFQHERTTLDEVRDVAQSMSLKLAVSCQPQVVGAKGGIRFSPQHPSAPHVLERFIRDNASIISRYWGTGADINTDHAIIDEHARAYCPPGTTTALDALRNSLSCGSRPDDVASLLQESSNATGWTLEEYCVGYVMAITLKELLTHQRPDLIGKVRLVIQGFGCVGTTFALAAEELGIGRVVGISSQYGFLINDDGIDCGAIDTARRMAVNNGRLQGYDARSFEAGLGQVGLHVTREVGSTDEKHLINFLACVRGEIFVPCAQRYVLTSRVISTLTDETFVQAPLGTRFIIAGANNVFDHGECIEDVARRLDAASICMLPDWVTNSGTANLFMRACSGLALKEYAVSNLEASAADTKAFVRVALSKAGYHQGNLAVWQACRYLAAARRKDGPVNLLGVKRMARLTMRTSDLERATRAITTLYNAKSNADRTLFQLPGSDDPTISIVQVSDDASPADIGISVQFSVYNLQKAREVLEAQSIDFRERIHNNEMTELILEREQAGYPMSLCQAPPQEPSKNVFTCPSYALGCVIGSTIQIDHYASIMSDTAPKKVFHEEMLGFTHLRTFTVNAGSAPEGQDDGLMHVMGLPQDEQRVLILTEGLTPASIFSRLLRHVDPIFTAIRERGWTTTANTPSIDLATGFRQFFLAESETGTVLEFVERRDSAKVGVSVDSDSERIQQLKGNGGSVIVSHYLGGPSPSWPDQVSIGPQTLFTLASLTKLPTTIAALQLVEKQLITLDADVSDLLPDLGRQQVLVGWSADGSPILKKRRNPITLRQLLTHSSGCGYDLHNTDLKRFRKFQGSKVRDKSTVIGWFDHPLLFEPGQGWEYGSGVDWAGRLVEQISGLPLEAYLKDHVWKPIGASSFTFWPDSPSNTHQIATSTHRNKSNGKLEVSLNKIGINLGVKGLF
ncbi:glu leu phe val dehydrogenase family [Fusarium tjaetaba]|uniref:Glu leu phe val dehydrogenase family n=1 Tax=Fusarium tjaetaba TaxID=1567544 RepID=A0A8H5QAN9_9HYPO|nr:glu leu phe val dehydrogenase family [Fusarium tjaetaba]KAF5611787.1 glu leu phe val dehydrogenase family [Fusarium tjaetaba]